MRKSTDHYATCYWCGQPIYAGAGEGAKVITDSTGSKHFHYMPPHTDCLKEYRNAIQVMRDMEEDAGFVLGDER